MRGWGFIVWVVHYGLQKQGMDHQLYIRWNQNYTIAAQWPPPSLPPPHTHVYTALDYSESLNYSTRLQFLTKVLSSSLNQWLQRIISSRSLSLPWPTGWNKRLSQYWVLQQISVLPRPFQHSGPPCIVHWCGNQKLLMWSQTPPKPHPPTLP